jgi:hypothetical protein
MVNWTNSLRCASPVALLLLVACGSPASRSQTPKIPPASGVEEFFPLGDGYVYTYETLDEDGRAEDMMLLRVRRSDPGRAELHTASGVRELVVTADSIRRSPGGFVLLAPLDKGAQWDGDNGGITRVHDVNVKLTVPAGTFDACIQTVEEISGATRGRITSVYCPAVGLARMTVEQWERGERNSKRFDLRSYGPPVNLDADR